MQLGYCYKVFDYFGAIKAWSFNDHSTRQLDVPALQDDAQRSMGSQSF